MRIETICAMGLCLPLLGTTLGTALVFCLKKEMNLTVQKALAGFASGVMLAASVFSLLIPAMEMEKDAGGIAWLPAAVGFMAGVLFLLLLNRLILALPMQGNRREAMLMFAVTLHNIPEGMAVGVVFAGLCSGTAGISGAAALALSAGIAIQNFPEGAIISMPLASKGLSRRRAFGYGFFSGVVEPIAAMLTMWLTAQISAVLPYILSFAAGAMIYVVIAELIPEEQTGKSNAGILGCAAGFVLMMVLDVALGG